MGSFEYLVDPEEMINAIEIIREIAEVQIINPPHPLSKTIQDLIVAPLEEYLEREHKATGGTGHAGTEIAIVFMMAAEDISEKLQRQNGFVFSEHVDLLEKRWRAFMTEIGWDARCYAKTLLPFAERDAKAQAARQSGGFGRGAVLFAENEDRNQAIADRALELIGDGRARDCVSILSQRTGLSPRQIRNILKSYQISTVQKIKRK